MDRKIIRKKITEPRENKNDRFRTTYGDKTTFSILQVEITREKTGETLVYEFFSSDLTDNDSIHFSTQIINGKMRIIWDAFIAGKARLI
jgi:hypothetical protein